MGGALEGFLVVERSSGAAAGYAGRMLATMGAEVLLAEPPEGSQLRREPPFLSRAPQTSALFVYLASGKGSVVCDLSSEGGRDRFARLLERADVLIDDTPVDERPALGLDPETIARRFPRLVFVSVLPFGASGPRAHWKGHDLTNLHAGGEGYLMPNGLTYELFPDRGPVKIYGNFANYQGGGAAAIATIAALMARESAGGQFVDISIQDANVMDSCFALQRFGDGFLEHRSTRAFRYGGVLECADGYVSVLTNEQHQWEGLVKLMGSPSWTEEHLKDPLLRGKKGAEINRGLRAWAKTQRVEDVVREGQACGVPIARYASPAEVVADPHERYRGFFSPVEVEGLGPCDVPVAPFKFSRTPAAVRSGPPRLGSSDAEIGAARS